MSYTKTVTQFRPRARCFKVGSMLVEYRDGSMAIVERGASHSAVARQGSKRQSV